MTIANNVSDDLELITACVHNAQHEMDILEKKPASALIKFLKKPLSETAFTSCGRLRWGQAIYPSQWPSLTKY